MLKEQTRADTLPVPYEEMIDCESWYHLADYHYQQGQTNLPTGIVHCDMGSIPEFFQEIDGNNERYIVISSRADFGLHYQEQFPPWQDYAKLVKQCLGPQNTNHGYANVTIPAPINLNRCKINHKYSIKCYRYTEATFNMIPSNVKKWFVTNNTIHDDPRIITIPFGINGTDGNSKPKQQISSVDLTKPKTKDMYVNFQFYTNERAALFELFTKSKNATVKKDIPFEEYIEDLAEHKAVLCPCGNGFDCYRTLEALYLGCIPIMEVNLGTIFYSQLNLPIIFSYSLEAFSHTCVLDKMLQYVYYNLENWNLEKVTLSYWQNIIEGNRKLLLY